MSTKQNELTEQYISRKEHLLQDKAKIKEVIAKQNRLLATADAEIDKISGELLLLHQEICEHSLETTSWKLDELESKIIVSLTCTKCAKKDKKYFNIEDGMKYLGIDRKPESELVYFLNHDDGTVYTVSKYATPIEKAEIHLRERYVKSWRKQQ